LNIIVSEGPPFENALCFKSKINSKTLNTIVNIIGLVFVCIALVLLIKPETSSNRNNRKKIPISIFGGATAVVIGITATLFSYRIAEPGGIFLAFWGLIIFGFISIIHGLMEFFKIGARFYLVVPVTLALGIVFLLAARECKQFWVIFAFGISFLISGLSAIILGLEKLKSMFEWWQKQPVLLLRVIAFIALAAGTIIIICA